MERIMYHCKNCGVDVDSEVCPLCHSATKKENDEGILTGYPSVKAKVSKRGIAKKMYLVLALLISFILLAVDLHFSSNLSWSVVCLATIFLGYIIIMHIFLNSLPSVFAKISKSMGALFLYLLFLDWFLKVNSGWSIFYAMPILLIIETVINFFFTVINHKNFQNYMIAQLLTTILGIVSFSIGSNFYLSLIAIVLSLLLFLSTLLFGGLKGTSEIKRRFHINPEE
jgi:RNA polymerase subunit RPABC4/transcription elongation factor Spt4